MQIGLTDICDGCVCAPYWAGMQDESEANIRLYAAQTIEVLARNGSLSRVVCDAALPVLLSILQVRCLPSWHTEQP